MVVGANKTANYKSRAGGPSKFMEKKRLARREEGSRRWLESMVAGEKFFGACEEHKVLRRSDVNAFCVDCCRRMCSYCVPQAGSCPHVCLLQIRRYIHQDVVRVSDMQKLVDCSDVQAYAVNGAKVVFLKPRRTSRPSKSPSGCPACELYGRSVTDAHRYCSIFCMMRFVRDEAPAGKISTVGRDASRTTSLPDPTGVDASASTASLSPPPPSSISSEPPPSPPPEEEEKGENEEEGDESRRIVRSPCSKRNRPRKSSRPQRSSFF